MGRALSQTEKLHHYVPVVPLSRISLEVTGFEVSQLRMIGTQGFKINVLKSLRNLSSRI